MYVVSSLQKKHSLESCIHAKEAYVAYFDLPVGDQDKRWASYVMCEYCRCTLEGWFRGKKRAMRFAIPRIWHEPSNHLTDCYFCVVDPSKRQKGKNAPSIKYPDLSSSIAPVPHTKDMPAPQPLLRDKSFMTDASFSDSETEQSSAACFQSRAAGERCPYYSTQEDINDLVRDPSLTKSNAEILISRLKQWDLLDDSVRITSQRKRHCGFSMLYTFKDGLCYCHDIEGVFLAIPLSRHSSSTAHLEASKLFCCTKQTSVPPFFWLIQFT